MTTFSGLHSFGDAQQRHPLQALRRTGTVTGITNVPFSVQVALGGDDPANAQPMPYVDSYSPAVNDVVVILSVGGDHIIIGRVNSLTTNHLNGYIEAHDSTPPNCPDGTWVEMSYDTVDSGGNAAFGQLSLSAGKLVVPRTGIWVIIPTNYFPSGPNYVHTITGSDVAGQGATGSTIPSRHEVYQTNSTGFNGHWNTAAVWPQYYAAGQTVTGYAWQQSASTVGLSFSRIIGYQVG